MNILATVSAIRYYPYYWYPALSPALMHGLSAGSSDHAGSQRKKNNCRYNNSLNSFILKFLCTITIVCQCAYTQILITELYRDPPGSESSLCGGASHEFIEILNIGTDTFKINNLFITDGMESDSVIPLREKLSMHPKCIYNRRFICPGQFALILDPDYSEALNRNGCALNIKDSTVLLICGDQEIGNGLSSDDGVVLYRGSKKEIDSVIAEAVDYSNQIQSPVAGKLTLASVSNKEGCSVELRSLIPELHFELNSNGITPGWSDMFRSGYIVEAKFGVPDFKLNSIPCTLYCLTTIQANMEMPLLWELYAGQNQIRKGSIELSRNSSSLLIDIPLIETDFVFVLNGISWGLDITSVWVSGSAVKINEIFPKAVNETEPEWLELVNNSAMTVNLRNWRIGNSEDQAAVSTENCLLGPGRFIVFTKDKKLFLKKYPGLDPLVTQPAIWHVLNNYRDTLCIWDSHGQLQDRICYQNAWFENWTDNSIERLLPDKDGLDSSNWALSVEPTPGFPNSNVFFRTRSKPDIEIGPVPFTPNGDGHDDLLLIKVTLPGAMSMRLSIVGFDGRLLYQFNGVKPQYTWDGKKNNGQYVANGPFFVVAKLTGGNSVAVIRKKGVLWR